MNRLFPAALVFALAACSSDPASPADGGTDAVADAEGSGDASADASDGSGSEDATTDGSGDAPDSSDDTTDGSGDTAEDVTPDVEPPSNACAAEGGICVSNATACSSGGGTRAAAGDSGCVFDDGPGACCVPPAAEATGDTCRSRGGLCAPIGGCNFVEGSFAPPASDCGSVPVIICCLPETVCGKETEVCCGDTVAFRPTCDRGTFTCDLFDGTTLRDEAECTF